MFGDTKLAHNKVSGIFLVSYLFYLCTFQSLFTRIHDACEEVEEEQRVSFNVSVR